MSLTCLRQTCRQKLERIWFAARVKFIKGKETHRERERESEKPESGRALLDLAEDCFWGD